MHNFQADDSLAESLKNMAADELDQSKSAIRRELESVVKVAAQKLSLDGSLSK